MKSETVSVGTPAQVDAEGVLKSAFVTFIWVIANIAASTSVVMANKAVIQTYGFHFVPTLNLCHYLTTLIFLEISSRASGTEESEPAEAGPRVPRTEAIILGVSSVAAISSQNLTLALNSVGFYQMSKLLIIPAVIVMDRVSHNMGWRESNKTYSGKTLFSLFIVAIGFWLSAVGDVQLTTLGFFVGMLLVLFTALFQFVQDGRVKRLGVSPSELTRAFAGPQALAGLALQFPFDVMLPELTGNLDSNVFRFEYTTPLLLALAASCLSAVVIQVTAVGVIGRTSAVTYQVIGQVKTLLAILGGFFFFDTAAPAGALMLKVTGIAAGLFGATLYANQTLKERGQVETDLLGCI
ncbi:hypothetical protein CYMTET_18210 [Cymbomonas tetramitiformis]|uniref:Sugar phosphate transporter domain-containing protein n=1 Tax=Cymbomonas tetramitiformis TaxID=36881 RepID=A0AAE0L657_9CHLO|nr:hypothetical protein CYMTET_18210 [Cymbomonas tetramitiformis]|eukprot:gene19394-23189_t